MIEIDDVLQQMDEIDQGHSSGRLWWGLLRDWLEQQKSRPTQRAADGAICPGCGEVKVEELVHCTRCGTFLPRR